MLLYSINDAPSVDDSVYCAALLCSDPWHSIDLASPGLPGYQGDGSCVRVCPRVPLYPQDCVQGSVRVLNVI